MKEFKPHDYQKLIISRILQQDRTSIFAGMGMGKTSSTLTALDGLFLSGDDKPALVLAPLRVCNSTWPEEARKWRHLRHIDVVPVTGVEKERKEALKRDASVYACNYQNLPWLIEHYGNHWPFDKVIADESTRLKSFRLRQGGVRARELSKVAHTKIKRFVNLTGTPAPNGLIDLWGQMWFVDAGKRLGKSFTAFRDRWFTVGRSGYGYTLRHPSCADEINNLLRDVCLTIDPKDYFKLEEPLVKEITVSLTSRAMDYYKKLERELIVEIEDHTITAANAAVKTQKLLQIANGAAYTDPSVDTDEDTGSRHYKILHDAKLEALDSIVEEANGAPLLVAYHFRSDLERLRKAFPKARLLDDNPETLTDWNNGRIKMLLAHPQSAGHGLNLQDGGNILVFFGHNWNLEDRQQIIERIGPMRQKQSGYDRPVWIYNIIAVGTVDRVVIDRLTDKKSIQDALLEGLKKT